MERFFKMLQPSKHDSPLVPTPPELELVPAWELGSLGYSQLDIVQHYSCSVSMAVALYKKGFSDQVEPFHLTNNHFLS